VKSPVPLRVRIHVGILVLLLVFLAISVVVTAVDADRWYPMLLAAGVLVTALGAAFRRRWSTGSVYAIATALSLEWIGGVAWSYFRGTLSLQLKTYSPLQVLLAFIPAGVYFFLVGYSCYVASRYVGLPRHRM